MNHILHKLPLWQNVWKETFTAFMNLSPLIIALLIGNICLQACYHKVLQWITIFHFKHESFPLNVLPYILCYSSNTTIYVQIFKGSDFRDFCGQLAIREIFILEISLAKLWLVAISRRAEYLVTLKNKIAKMMNLWCLHASKICI